MRAIVVIAAFALITGCIGSDPVSDTGTSESVGVSDANSGNFAEQTLASINSYRRQQGLRPLQSNQVLYKLAMQHSQNQAAAGRISHNGSDQRRAVARSAGMEGCGENVGYRHTTPQSVVRHWSNSPGHRRIMLTPDMRYAAVARHGPYVTFFACR